MCSAAEAGAHVVDLATNEAYSGKRTYFTLVRKDGSSPGSMYEEMQQTLWMKSAEWAGITQKNTSLTAEFE